VANHYATLGLGRDAPRREVVQAYRRLVRRHHPDAGGDVARFREIQGAYDVLGDERKRAEYDAEIERRAPRPTAPPPAAAARPPAPPTYAQRTYGYRTPQPISLPTPSTGTCGVAAALGLGTFALPALAATIVFQAHGNVVLLVGALVVALVLGKAARALAGTEAERVRRHRQLWSYGLVLPDPVDRELADRCDRLATIANRCVGFGLTGAVGMICLLGALHASS
jgi:hypothetical protein